MKILAIRTERPIAELYIYNDQKKLAEAKWQAQRILADTVNQKLDKLLNMLSFSLNEIDGIVCFEGPGSFTGLRVGMSFGNALAYALNKPIVAHKSEDWIEKGIRDLQAGKSQKIATPYYDRPAATTLPKK